MGLNIKYTNIVYLMSVLKCFSIIKLPFTLFYLYCLLPFTIFLNSTNIMFREYNSKNSTSSYKVQLSYEMQ